MTDQRSAIRFRVPQLRPPVPPPRPATNPTQTPSRRPPVRPLPTRTPPPPTRAPSPQPQPLPPPPPPPSPRAPTPPPALSVVPSPRPQTLPTPPEPSPSPRPQTLPPPPVESPPPLSLFQPQDTTPDQSSALLESEIKAPPPSPFLSLGTVPASLRKPSVQQSPSPTPTQTPTPAPASVPASAPAPIIAKPLEPTKTESLPQAAQPSPANTSPPSSPSKTRIHSPVSSHPPSPSNMPTQPHVSATSPPSRPTTPLHVPPPQPPSSPASPRLEPKNTSGVKWSTELTSNNGQKGVDATHETAQKQDSTSTELSSEHSNSETRARSQKPQIKPMVPRSEDKTSVPASPETPKVKEAQAPHCEKGTTLNTPQQFMDKKHASTVTIAGDNKGTSMHIGYGAKKERSIHIIRRYKASNDEITDTTSDGEESSKEENEENEIKDDDNEEQFGYINCNIQGINNSMVINCSFTERNPGVHLGSSWKKNRMRKYRKLDVNKVKVNVNPLKKRTVRRRCLRGLFMESSDSDNNDPEKPRRHGCRYTSGEKSSKDEKTSVV